MLSSAVKLTKAVIDAARIARVGPSCYKGYIFTPLSSSPQFRLIHDGMNGPSANPVAIQMINYALSLAKSQKSDESHAQAMLILEQCLSSQSSEGLDVVTQNSKGIVLIAMSDLLFARGNYDDAMEKLQKVQDLALSSLDVKVAAMEALVGLNLELGHDDTSSVLADKCLELLGKDIPKSSGGSFEVVDARAKAVKGLVELVCGDTGSAESFFQGYQEKKSFLGPAALSYGEIFHATGNFSLAKELYHKVIQEVSENKDFTNMHALAACNMASEEVLLGATCALGQLQAHMRSFGDAEETLTKALNKAEEVFGCRHPKVGVVLTCLAIMFRHKAVQERSSSLLIQEGLYRRALELLKAPSLGSEGDEATEIRKMEIRRDIASLARGGYAEALSVQENRKGEGEKMKRWAEAVWRNPRMSLAEVLKISESSNKVPVIDVRIGRVL